MLIDARTVERGTTIKAAVCVVGSGAAGISLAMQFRDKGVPVVLLESGGLTEDARCEALNQGRVEGTLLDSGFWPPHYSAVPGEGYLAGSRRRYFGGTTNAWGGWCRPFDPIDFAEREWVSDSGWPITKAELAPFYRRAAGLCQIKPFDEGTYHAGWEGRPALPGDEMGLRTLVVYYSPPTRFGTTYRSALVRSTDVRIFTWANVVDLETPPQANRVRRAKVACLSGNSFNVEAERFVLATGGVENARLLLLANKVQPEGLGNGNGLVGRYFMDHAYTSPGYFLALADPARYGLYFQQHEGSVGHDTLGVLCLDEGVQRRHRLQNVWIALGSTPHLPEYPAAPEDHHLARAVRSYTCAPGFRPRLITLTASPECSPNRNSRVTLGDEVDALGCRRAKVDWRVNEADGVSVRQSLELIAQALGRLSMGRVRLLIAEDNPFPRGWGGTHHSGTTRMSRDPRKGVVNADCRMHQVENLYVVGSSVFPTLGAANPTFTIVALALRLADHLLEAVKR
jgi:choline dehydrogenase-like flavoprotein